MGAGGLALVDQGPGSFTCLCGTSWDQHKGKDHQFVLDPSYYSATWHRGSKFGRDELNPATNLYITVEDRMRISVLAPTGGQLVDVVLRLQRSDGQVIPMQFEVKLASSNAVQNFDFDLTEGFLLDAALFTPTASVRIGAVFVVVQIIRGNGANAIPSRTMISNYVSSGNVVGWPESANQQGVQGAGVPVSNQNAAPGAGAEINFQVPVPFRWYVQSISFTFTTSAVVGNRIPHFRIVDTGGNILWDCPASAAQAANTTVRYSLCGGVQPSLVDGAAIAPIPDSCLMLQQTFFRTLTTAIDVGDVYSIQRIFAIQWLEL